MLPNNPAKFTHLRHLCASGGYPDMDHLALRTLYLTVSAFCLLMFVHFTTIITAEMTSGPADIPIKNFGDVLELGYDVIYQTKYIGDLLKTSDAESAKNKGPNSIDKILARVSA